MAIRVQCPCGKRLSNFEDKVPFLADFLPEQHCDEYCEAIEEAIREHPGDSETTAGWAIDRSVALFRQVWQCTECGRLLVLGPDRKYYSFVPESSETPKTLLAAHLPPNPVQPQSPPPADQLR